MEIYERFLAFEIVVNVKTEEELLKFIERCKSLKLNSIKYLERFKFNELHKNAGIQTFTYGELCVEFQLMKGFTIDKKKDYLDYGCEVISVEDFLIATN